MSGRRDATGRRCCSGAQRTRSRASVAARQVVATHGVAEVEPVWPQDEVTAHRVVDDEPCDEPRDVPKQPDARRSQSSRR
jgi:phosphatidate phosphatase APP1